MAHLVRKSFLTCPAKHCLNASLFDTPSYIHTQHGEFSVIRADVGLH